MVEKRENTLWSGAPPKNVGKLFIAMKKFAVCCWLVYFPIFFHVCVEECTNVQCV